MAASTSISLSTISGNISTLPTKHISILLLKHKVIYSASRERVRTRKIYKNEGRRQASNYTLRLGLIGTRNQRNYSFITNEEEYTQRPKRPPKPRSRKYETEEEFQARIREWEALLPHEQVVKPK